MRKIIYYIIYVILILLIIITTINLIFTKIRNTSSKNVSTKESIVKIKQEVKLKNSIKLKYKLVNDSKDRVYTIMYFRDLTSRHNLGFGYEYTDSKIDKRAFLVEYTYKF